MKILVFYQYFGTTSGSWSTRIYELSKRWVNNGHQVTVVTAPYEKSDTRSLNFIEKQSIEGIELIIIDAKDSNKDSTFKRAINAVIFSIVASWYALTLKADVVIASSGPITIGIPALLARYIRKRKMVFEVRDLWPQGAEELKKIKNKILIKLGYNFERICYQSASLVVPCSIGMQQSICKRFPETKTLVVPHASATDVFLYNQHIYPTQFPVELTEKHIFIYAGSLGLMDDCEQILEAFRLIQDNKIALVFLGDGAERNFLEKRAKQLQLTNVYFMGLIPKYEVAKWFSIARASLITFKNYPVLHTSSPNKLFDSLAAGLPIIHNTSGWIKNMVDLESCGFSVQPENSSDFAKAVVSLSSDDELHRSMSEQSIRLALTDYNINGIAANYLKHLEQIYLES